MNVSQFCFSFVNRFAVPIVLGGPVYVREPYLKNGPEWLEKSIETPHVRHLSELIRYKMARLFGLDIKSQYPAFCAEDVWPTLAMHDLLHLARPESAHLSDDKRLRLLLWVRYLLTRTALPFPEPLFDVKRSVTCLYRHVFLNTIWEITSKFPFQDLLLKQQPGLPEPLISEIGQASPLVPLLIPPPYPMILTPLVKWLRVPHLARMFVTRQLQHGASIALARIGTAVLAQISGLDPTVLQPDEMETLLVIFSLFHLRTAVSLASSKGYSGPGQYAFGPEYQTPDCLNSLALYIELWNRYPHFAVPTSVFREKNDSMIARSYRDSCRKFVDPSIIESIQQKWKISFDHY